MSDRVKLGDIVRVDGPGLEHNGRSGLVLDIIPYTERDPTPGSRLLAVHPDEYSCKLELFQSLVKQAIIRAKWLKIISKAKDK